MRNRSFLRRLAGAALMLGLLGATAAPAAAGPRDGDGAVPAAARPLRIMPLGDSITWGVGSRRNDGYRTVLKQRLGAAGMDVDFVGSAANGTGTDPDHEGHKGWTVGQVSAHVNEWLSTYEPDVILLHIGTNDMVRSIPDAAWRLSGLLDKIAANRPGAEVFVAQVVGLADYPDIESQQQRTARYNRAVAKLVAGHGARFHLVDQSDIHGIDMFNSVHPNDYGYAEMAWNWYRAMEPVLNDGSLPWPHNANPYQARVSYRCIAYSTLDPAVRGCHRWYHRRPAGAVSTRVWQLPVRTRVEVGGAVKIVTRWVSAH